MEFRGGVGQGGMDLSGWTRGLEWEGTYVGEEREGRREEETHGGQGRGREGANKTRFLLVNLNNNR